jgi:cobalt-zinc-cadmium efflux system membrane fusion protein
MEQAQTDAVSAESDRDAALQQLRALGIEGTRLAEIEKGGTVAGAPGAIRAPIDGTVVEKLITPGQLLQAGTTPCFTVADLSTVWVMASVFEADLPGIGPGDAATIGTEASAQPLPGKVDYIASLVDPNTRAVSVRVVARNAGGVLRKDAYVRVAIQGARAERGLLIPVSAVLRDDQNLPFVYVQGGDGGFARHAVTLGTRSGDQQEVRSGLQAGDAVAVEGALFLQFAESQ